MYREAIRPRPDHLVARTLIEIVFILIFVALIGPAGYLLLTGDFPGALLFYGRQEDDPLVVSLLHARHSLFGR